MDRDEKDIRSLNEIIDRLRKGELNGTLEIKITLEGKSLFVKQKLREDSGTAPAGAKDAESIVFPKTDLSYLNVRGLDVSGSDFSGLRLKKAEFSESVIEGGDFSGSDLEDAGFKGAFISETTMARAYNINVRGSYITGSVNLNEAHAENDTTYQLHPMPKGGGGGNVYSTGEHRTFDGDHFSQGRGGRHGGGMAGGDYH